MTLMLIVFPWFIGNGGLCCSKAVLAVDNTDDYDGINDFVSKHLLL